MKTVPPIGQFRRKVQFKNFSKDLQDSAGYLEDALPPFAESWAAVKQTGQGRSFEVSTDQQVTTYDIWVRHSNDLAAGLRRDTQIVYNGKNYSIEAVDPVEEGTKRFYFFKAVGVQ